jgi:hypothetical protein
VRSKPRSSAWSGRSAGAQDWLQAWQQGLPLRWTRPGVMPDGALLLTFTFGPECWLRSEPVTAGLCMHSIVHYKYHHIIVNDSSFEIIGT